MLRILHVIPKHSMCGTFKIYLHVVSFFYGTHPSKSTILLSVCDTGCIFGLNLAS